MANIGLWTPNNTDFTERFRYRVNSIDSNDADEKILLTNKNFLIVYSETIYPPTNKLLKGQFELPLQALDWVLMNIARLPLPKDKGGGILTADGVPICIWAQRLI